MYSFETLLRASTDEIVAIIAAVRVGLLEDKDLQRETMAQRMGINVTQLICSFGFNPEALGMDGLSSALGYPSLGSLMGERNYMFIHDRYHDLSVNNILEIYAAMPRHGAAMDAWSDLVMSRLTTIEGQLEETINPILIGGYKLEIRAVYEHRFVSERFVEARLHGGYEVLRNISNESMIMLETGAISPPRFLRNRYVTVDEKCRAVYQGVLPRDAVEEYLAQSESETEKIRLLEALAR